jgi:alanyl-tRNA synthetase
MDARLALRERIRIKRKEDEEKLKKAKKELDEKKKEDLKELEEMEKENKKKLEKLEEHNEERLHNKEMIDQKRELAVEGKLERILDEDPIKKMDDLAHVIGHLSRAITPRSSHERIPLRVNLNSNAVASGYGMGEGGRGSSANLLRVPVFEHQHE